MGILTNEAKQTNKQTAIGQGFFGFVFFVFCIYLFILWVGGGVIFGVIIDFTSLMLIRR
jgi:hypothetical protein